MLPFPYYAGKIVFSFSLISNVYCLYVNTGLASRKNNEMGTLDVMYILSHLDISVQLLNTEKLIYRGGPVIEITVVGYF